MKILKQCLNKIFWTWGHISLTFPLDYPIVKVRVSIIHVVSSFNLYDPGTWSKFFISDSLLYSRVLPF